MNNVIEKLEEMILKVLKPYSDMDRITVLDELEEFIQRENLLCKEREYGDYFTEE